jgi:NADPH-dependent 2,4-dienoyl-CoA reductase/sulfur reductase-like enzyme
MTAAKPEGEGRTVENDKMGIYLTQGPTNRSIAQHGVVVIGSGPGGAVTSSALAEHGKDVVLIEEEADWPVESCGPFSIDETKQKYRCAD